MKAVVLYEMGSATMEEITEIFPRHKALIDFFVKEGKIIAIGPFSNIADGALGIFRKKEHAEEFVKQDPFVLEGAVGKVIIREWNEILLG
ncbi:MAG: YciI family protein [Syntrophomonas sp.]